MDDWSTVRLCKAFGYASSCAAWLLMHLAYASPVMAQELHWYRGNTHTHTVNSDGDSTPQAVARWYREHGYQFLVITDHEYLTDVTPLNGVAGALGKFLLIPGEEITQTIEDKSAVEGKRIVHVNAINPNHEVHALGPLDEAGTSRIAPAGTTVAEALAHSIREARSAGALVEVNHPNSLWSIRSEDLQPVEGPYLLEIWNPNSNNLGGTDDSGHVSPSTEALWDSLLSRGRVVWGVGCDDSHFFHQYHFENREAATPGKAWIMVRARELSLQAIVDALTRGDFYATTGIALNDYAASRQEIALAIKQSPLPDQDSDTRYQTTFSGSNGRTLAIVPGLTPRYRVRGDEGYVRAVVMDSDGRRAWLQPMFLAAAAAPSPR
jgi:hypothetical protein